MESQTSAREIRGTAVDKLRRAASLPRMSNGRRPAMHAEGVSEGERSTPDTSQNVTRASSMEREAEVDAGPEVVASEKEETQPQFAEPEPEPTPEPEEATIETEPRTATPDSVSRKRRSRSRTRSRTSRDLKGKARATPPPTPTPRGATPGNESSPDESHASLPQDAHQSTSVVAPRPSHFSGIQQSPLLHLDTETAPSPDPFRGTSPFRSPHSPLPSLQDLQMNPGLYRSASAAARMMAMSKLTGEPMDPTFSPLAGSPPPLPGMPTRNNTFSVRDRGGGGDPTDRAAARNQLFRRLGERRAKENGDVTSGGEDAPPPPASPKRRRRRSRHRSSTPVTATPSGAESDLPSTTPNTPIVPPEPLPPTPALPLADMPTMDPARAPSTTPSYHERLNKRQDEYDGYRIPRSVFVEDEDAPDSTNVPPSEADRDALSNLPKPPGFSPSLHPKATRAPYSSDAPSNFSADSGLTPGSATVPFFLSATQRTPSKQDDFPSSPFGTPMKEISPPPRDDDDDERVLYHRQQSPFHDAYGQPISWIAESVPEKRVYVEEDDDEHTRDQEEEEEDVEPSTGSYPPRQSSTSQEILIESEASPEPPASVSNAVPSPPAIEALMQSVHAHESDESFSPRPLSVGSPVHPDFGGDGTDWDEARPGTADPHKRSESTSAWGKFKDAWTGRRSRTNSIVNGGHRHTDSTVSRESRVSVTSPKADSGTGEVFAQQQQQQQPQLQAVHSAPAAASAVSLTQQQINTTSGMPMASAADQQKYLNAKLFPFPGIKTLEEQRNRSRGMSMSASNPDITTPSDTEARQPATASSTNLSSPEVGRERKLSHMGSDSQLLAKYNSASPSPSASNVPPSSFKADYFSSQQPRPAPTHTVSSGSLKLPTNREGVKRWLSKNKLFSSQSTSPGLGKKKTSLNDIFKVRKDTEVAEWEESVGQKLRAPTTASGSTVEVPQAPVNGRKLPQPPTSPRVVQEVRHAGLSDVERTPKARKVAPEPLDRSTTPNVTSEGPSPFPSPSDHLSSTTPDPLSSLDDYQPRSTSGSSTDTSSQFSSYGEERERERETSTQSGSSPSQGAVVLERLDDVLRMGARNPMWAGAIDQPLRKLVLSSPVLQVANPNTVKDRFLFLFNDMLVIAKPQDQDSILDRTKPTPGGRKFVVKNAVLLSQLKFSADREQTSPKHFSSATSAQHVILRTFVNKFATDVDEAIGWLFDRTHMQDDPVALGQLLFKTLDLDRAQLGAYLSRRTSRVVLRAYLDGFGFLGLRVDRALRIFLLSIHCPASNRTGSSPLEMLLDAFASRWYDANAGKVAYDKDLAIRLVRAVVQLNDVMHGGISDEPGPTNYPRRNVTVRDFTEAFRRYDQRRLVSDDILTNVYNSIRAEKLVMCRNPSSSKPPLAVTIKRPLPPRLTYKMQSDPIIVRIPAPDPQLTIHLFGQDLQFDPPTLHFSKSSEASFRVTGTSLGPKMITMSRHGPNGLLYTGVPLGSPLLVERAFMRNTFQVAFADHQGGKRRYMFSVDDPLVRHQWTVSLRRQIDDVLMSAPSTSSQGSSMFHRAAERMAFKVLQDTLIEGPEQSSPPTPSTVDDAGNRIASSQASNGSAMRTNGKGPYDPLSTIRNGRGGERLVSSSHTRSKSRSAVYHKHGQGKFEPGLSDIGRDRSSEETYSAPSDVRLWTENALTRQCVQNSSIALVLSYLQVGSPDHERNTS